MRVRTDWSWMGEAASLEAAKEHVREETARVGWTLVSIDFVEDLATLGAGDPGTFVVDTTVEFDVTPDEADGGDPGPAIYAEVLKIPSMEQGDNYGNATLTVDGADYGYTW
jgi:hypothetical protein